MQPENLIHLCLTNVEIDTIYDLQGLRIERSVNLRLQNLRLENLPKLRNICLGPKNILSFQNLSQLVISSCKSLQVIFSASILRFLPHLSKLVVSNCQELVQIIEETASIPSHNNCFPDLVSIEVKMCKSLECLLFISTCGMLPNLKELKIEDAPKLVNVFECKQDEAKKDVLPKLSTLHLKNLPSLVSVCQGIDFQRVLERVVQDCAEFSLTSSTTKDLDNEGKQAFIELKNYNF